LIEIASMTTSSTPRFRLHLESRSAQWSAFHLDPAAWATASARHPELAARIEPSFGWDGKNLSEALVDSDFLLASRFSKAVVNAAPRLRWIHTTVAGVDGLLPLDELRADLVLTNSSGIHGDKAREYVQMALLMLNAQLPALATAQREHRWRVDLTGLIRGKTVVVVGYGDIGMAAGRGAKTLGLKVIGVTRSGRPLPDDSGADRIVSVAQLDEVLPEADFVVVTAPLTAETRNILSAERLARMRPGAGLINIARAALVDYPALLERLRSGACGGAILDVFDPEPLPADVPYWDMPNLIVTPHCSCDLPDYNQRALEVWFDNFGRWLRKEPLRNQVDRKLGY